MKDIRSNFVKESILDYENLANSLKENTSNIVKDLLAETVKETYAKILTESDEDEYEVEEVNDTESEETNDAENDFQSEEGSEVEETNLEEPTEEVAQEPNEGENGEIETEGENEEWAEFDKFKVSDGEYDFSQANDDEIVKVYKLLKDTDQVLVNADKESGKVEIKDNETGAEYLLDLSCMNSGSGCEATNDPMITDDSEFGKSEADGEFNDDEYMQESRFYELVLNEYDSHVGYTDNYQKKDVMTNPGTSEPGKNVNDWDAGVPKGDSKPWAGKNGNSKPFEKKVSSELSESEEVINEEDEVIEEANLSQSRWNDTHAVHNRVPAANDDANRRNGMQKTSKGAKYRAHGTSESTLGPTESKRVENALAESKAMMKKVDKILTENEELKSALNKFKNVLQEAAVTNYTLGQIVKVISENTTSKDEKKEIINRFSEAKSIEQAKQLFESISCELQKRNTMSINEEKQFTANSSKMINETQIYKSKDLLDSLDLMHRLCK